MRITSFAFRDKRSGWTLDETSFDATLNLLIGASGVGKTRIVRALRLVCEAARRSDVDLGEVEWAIRFEHEGCDHHWELETAKPPTEELPAGLASASTVSQIVREQLVVDGQGLIDRTAERFVFRSADNLPKLKRSDSALVLLAEETALASARQGFTRVLFSEAGDISPVIVPTAAFREKLEKVNGGHRSGTLAALRTRAAASLMIPGEVLVIAYLMQRYFPDAFGELSQRYRDTFPSVQDIKILETEEAERLTLEFALREEGCSEWIRQRDISSGMLKTLTHLFEVATVPPGSVVVIDEFENSLGANCMPAVVDLLSERGEELQYILTSHHPYVINQVPWQSWKLVRRKGSRVSLTSARDIPALQSASHLDAFTRLVNLPEYEHGIA